ncbi:MAG: ABC transporter permease [Pseudomonadota bacterium]
MKAMLALALQSAWSRRFVLSLLVATVALSTFLLLGLERLRQDVRETFIQSVSGTDLIVGPRSGSLQLLLSSVFRIGAPLQSMRWSSAQALAGLPAVAWSVPLSVGDSHRGFSVLGTTTGYFEHFRYGDRQALRLGAGRPFAAALEAVLGADVARQLGYKVGDRITLSHGDGKLDEHEHDDKPFEVVGIFERTGTPVDRTVHVGLEGLEAVHLDWSMGVRLPAQVSATDSATPDLTPRSVSAVLVGLKQRAAVFSVQQWVGAFRGEPLSAVLPGVALNELWALVGVGERALLGMTILVCVVSFAGLVAAVLSGLEQRRRELAILRALGAGPRGVLVLLATEGLAVTAAGVVVGAGLHWLAVASVAELTRAHFGLTLNLLLPGPAQWLLIGGVLACGLIASLLPGWRAYRLSLMDGLTPRI